MASANNFIFIGHQITSEIDNDLLKSLKFTMFSKKDRYFLVSQLPFSILIMLFCSKGSFATVNQQNHVFKTIERTIKVKWPKNEFHSIYFLQIWACI